MSRKGENIYRRADGRWEGRYIKGYDVLSGKARYGYVYAKSYEKARERRQHAMETEKARRKSGQAWSSRPDQNSDQKWNHEKERNHGQEWNHEQKWNGRLEGKRRQAKTVEDCLRRWLAGKEKDTALHPSTIHLYRRQIQKHILPVLGSCRIERVTAEVLEEFQKEKLERGRLDGRGGLSQAVTEGLMSILYAMLQEALEKGEIQEIPQRRNKKRAKRFPNEGQAFSEEEQIKLEKTLFCMLRGKKERGISMGILFAIYTGLRVGELAGLQWRDIDLKKSTVSVCRTLQRMAAPAGHGSKTVLQLGPPKSSSSRRTFPVKEELIALLRNYKKRLPREKTQPESPVFSNDKGGYAEPRLFQKFFVKVLREAGVEKRKFHALRHTFATRCIEKSMDIQSLSECLGHSKGKITLQVYTHSFTEHKRRCMKKLSFLWNINEIEGGLAQLSS